jgi:hypothetical protein
VLIAKVPHGHRKTLTLMTSSDPMHYVLLGAAPEKLQIAECCVQGR